MKHINSVFEAATVTEFTISFDDCDRPEAELFAAVGEYLRGNIDRVGVVAFNTHYIPDEQVFMGVLITTEPVEYGTLDDEMET